MKKLLIIISVLAILLAVSSVSAATSLVKRLSGRLVLQVEDKGQMWYIDPKTLKAIFIGSQYDVDRLKTEFALPISDSDLNKIAVKGRTSSNYNYAKSLTGKILLQSSTGKLWYVNPIDYKKYDLGTNTEVITTLHREAIGISQKNFALLPQGVCAQDLYSCSSWSVCDQSMVQNRTCEKVFDCLTAVTPSPVTSQVCSWTPPACTAVEYSAWTGCFQGIKERTIINKSPSGCVGGVIEPLVKSCLWVDANALPVKNGVKIGLQTTEFADYRIEIFDQSNILVSSLSGNLEFYNRYYQFSFNGLGENKDFRYRVIVIGRRTSETVYKAGNFKTLDGSELVSSKYNIANWDDEQTSKSCSSCVFLKALNINQEELSFVTWKLYPTTLDFTNSPSEVMEFSDPESALYHIMLPYGNAWTVVNQSENFSGSSSVSWLEADSNLRYYWSAIAKWSDDSGSHYVDLGWDQNRTIFYQSYNQ